MARDIVIIPNRDFTGSTTQPEIRFSGLTGASITLKVEDDGKLVFEGNTGGLFEIIDNKDGLISSVSDVSGLPIFSVYSDDRVIAGRWDNPGLTVSATTVFIGPTGVTNSTLHVSGDTSIIGTVNSTYSYIDSYIDLNPQTTLPTAYIGRMFFSGTPLFRLMINTGGTSSDWIIV